MVEAVEDGGVEEGRREEGGMDGDERHPVVCRGGTWEKAKEEEEARRMEAVTFLDGTSQVTDSSLGHGRVGQIDASNGSNEKEQDENEEERYSSRRLRSIHDSNSVLYKYSSFYVSLVDVYTVYSLALPFSRFKAMGTTNAIYSKTVSVPSSSPSPPLHLSAPTMNPSERELTCVETAKI